MHDETIVDDFEVSSDRTRSEKRATTVRYRYEDPSGHFNCSCEVTEIVTHTREHWEVLKRAGDIAWAEHDRRFGRKEER